MSIPALTKPQEPMLRLESNMAENTQFQPCKVPALILHQKPIPAGKNMAGKVLPLKGRAEGFQPSPSPSVFGVREASGPSQREKTMKVRIEAGTGGIYLQKTFDSGVPVLLLVGKEALGSDDPKKELELVKSGPYS